MVQFFQTHNFIPHFLNNIIELFLLLLGHRNQHPLIFSNQMFLLIVLGQELLFSFQQFDFLSQSSNYRLQFPISIGQIVGSNLIDWFLQNLLSPFEFPLLYVGQTLFVQRSHYSQFPLVNMGLMHCLLVSQFGCQFVDVFHYNFVVGFYIFILQFYFYIFFFEMFQFLIQSLHYLLQFFVFLLQILALFFDLFDLILLIGEQLLDGVGFCLESESFSFREFQIFLIFYLHDGIFFLKSVLQFIEIIDKIDCLMILWTFR